MGTRGHRDTGTPGHRARASRGSVTPGGLGISIPSSHPNHPRGFGVPIPLPIPSQLRPLQEGAAPPPRGSTRPLPSSRSRSPRGWRGPGQGVLGVSPGWAGWGSPPPAPGLWDPGSSCLGLSGVSVTPPQGPAELSPPGRGGCAGAGGSTGTLVTPRAADPPQRSLCPMECVRGWTRPGCQGWGRERAQAQESPPAHRVQAHQPDPPLPLRGVFPCGKGFAGMFLC